MAKRQLTGYQKGIVKRYYEHRDTIAITRLQELVSELYLESSAKKQAQLWTRAEKALATLDANDARVRTILDEKDVEKLAALLGEIK